MHLVNEDQCSPYCHEGGYEKSPRISIEWPEYCNIGLYFLRSARVEVNVFVGLYLVEDIIVDTIPVDLNLVDPFPECVNI